jgi:hypothetical protein
MRNRRRKAILDRCIRALRKAERGDELNTVQIENIQSGRRLLLLFIRDLASLKPKYADVMERALNDVHPRTEYCNAMLIRDIADTCITLNRVEQGRRRSEGKKHDEAMMFITVLKDEFSGQHPPPEATVENV